MSQTMPGKIMQISLIFGLAVVVGILFHPLVSILFLVAAKLTMPFFVGMREGYQGTYRKRKRAFVRHDGERYEVIADNEQEYWEQADESKQAHL